MSSKPCWVVAVVAGLGIAVAAPAQPPRNPPFNEPAAASAAPAAGRFLAIPGLSPLSMGGVQREIGLTSDQKRQLKAISDRYAAAVGQLGTTFERLEPEEKQKQGKEFSERAAAAARSARHMAETVLSPQQLRAVKKIAFELSATLALTDPKTQEKLGLSANQCERLNQVFEQAGDKMQQLQRDTAQRTMQILDEEQAAALKAQINVSGKPQ
jgi:hypothetical protein